MNDDELKNKIINSFKENRFSDVLELTEKIGIEDRAAGLENIIGISKYNKKDLTLKDLQDALLCFERAFLKDKNSIHGFNGLLNIIKTGTKACHVVNRFSEFLHKSVEYYLSIEKDYENNEEFLAAGHKLFSYLLDYDRLKQISKKILDSDLRSKYLRGVAIFENNFGRAMLNTFFVSTCSVVGGLLINSMAGFAFAQFRFRGDNIIFAFVLLSFAVPADAIAIPLFKMMRQIGWFDTFYALIIPMLPNGLIIFLFRQFFLGIPKELTEASRVDGLSWFGVYLRICMPLSIPVTLGAGLLLFVGQWESFLWPLIAAPSPELHLIQVTLGRFATEYEAIWNQQFAASSIAGLLPLIFIYLFQRQFVSALTGIEQK